MRQSLFGNIAIGENFEARDHGKIIVKQILTELFLRGQHAIDAKADARRIAIRLHMNVTSVGVERVLQNIINKLNDETGVINIISRPLTRGFAWRRRRCFGGWLFFLFSVNRLFNSIIVHTGGKIAGLDKKKLNILIADSFNLIAQSRLGGVDRANTQKTAFAGKRQNVFVDDHFFGNNAERFGLNISGRKIFAAQGISARQNGHHQFFIDNAIHQNGKGFGGARLGLRHRLFHFFRINLTAGLQDPHHAVSNIFIILNH